MNRAFVRLICPALVCATLAIAGAAPAPPAAKPKPAPRSHKDEDPGTDVATYLQAMEKEGLLSRESGTPARLAAALETAEAKMQDGQFAKSAELLYAIVESPAYTDFSDSESYQNAEYDLGVSLLRSHAYAAAAPFFGRALDRGPEGLYYRAAVRRLVDIALETRDATDALKRLGALPPGNLPEEVRSEQAYLTGRTALDAGATIAAEDSLTKVGKKSRFYAAALYLRGVSQAQRGQFKGAAKAFCEIVNTPDESHFTFYVDDRYFKIKDLARLGLGRIAHEQNNFDDAYYHYFQIPDDSPRLPEALFEAAWSMYAHGEDETARDLLDELARNFPQSPLVPDAALLRAHADLRSCNFDESKKGFDAVLAKYEPLQNEALEVLRDPRRGQAFLGRILARDATGDVGATAKASGSLEDRLLDLVKVDPRFVRLHEAIHGLQQEMADVNRVADEWRDLSKRLAGGPAATGVAKVGKALAEDPVDAARELAAEAEALEKMARDLTAGIDKNGRSKGIGAQADLEQSRQEAQEILKRAQSLRDRAAAGLKSAETKAEAEVAAGGPGLAQLAAIDAARAASAPKRSAATLDKALRTASRMGAGTIQKLELDLTRTLEKARLGKIDAVIGQKRKLELEIEDLAAGRFPPELFGRLYASGAIADDEEYWPFEGEYWADEYEGYR